MPSPAKPPKIPRNNPHEFKETMAATMPRARAPRGLSDTQLRYGLYGVWVAATVVAGIAVGLLLASNRAIIPATVNPTPVATTSLTAAPVQSGDVGAVNSGFGASSIQVVPSYSITQAQAGTPLITTTTAQTQPSAGPANLLPGYASKNNLQGSVGTAPVQ